MYVIYREIVVSEGEINDILPYYETWTRQQDMMMLEQAFLCLRGAAGTYCFKSAIDDEVLIVGYWHYNQLNNVTKLYVVLESVKRGSYKSSAIFSH